MICWFNIPVSLHMQFWRVYLMKITEQIKLLMKILFPLGLWYRNLKSVLMSECLIGARPLFLCFYLPLSSVMNLPNLHYRLFNYSSWETQFAWLNASSLGLPSTQAATASSPTRLMSCRSLTFFCFAFVPFSETHISAPHTHARKASEATLKTHSMTFLRKSQLVTMISNMQRLCSKHHLYHPSPQGRHVSLLSIPLIFTYCWYT